VAGLTPAGHLPTPAGQVAGVSDYDYRRFDFNYADSDAWVKHGFDAASLGLTTGSPAGYYASLNSPVAAQPSRFSEWDREFQAMLKADPTGNGVPAFMSVRFMRDHTMGLNPGNGSPSALMADNDYAVGELVEAVSKSPIWDSTAIIVVEDDSQFSSDHVDTHRSFVQVISPWIKQSTVDHHFYDTNSVLKTIELLLGLGPMSQYDHFATPIIGGWDSAPHNDAAYSAVLPAKSIIGQVNPSVASYAPNDPRRQLAELSSEMNWKVADAAAYDVLDRVLWADVKGAGSAMPAPRESTLALSGVQQAGQSGDGDD
jgi:Phosphoesterase family